MSSEINLWQNKKMQNFDQRKKRKLLTDNIIRMKAVNKFINISLFPIINKAYKNGNWITYDVFVKEESYEMMM